MMKRVIFVFVALLLLSGCAASEKGIWVTDSFVFIEGNVSPEFLRENTSEAQDVKPDVKPNISIIPGIE
ncbi:MAG: membrane lipoprotein lipid attachment site-containing protein [Dehalococcoidia bacterium]|jgi:uncharacterized protein YcfL|nr:membrane lipoprotein lipid attachment site-containing protein [Dehalococcoidia bacterium]